MSHVGSHSSSARSSNVQTRLAFSLDARHPPLVLLTGASPSNNASIRLNPIRGSPPCRNALQGILQQRRFPPSLVRKVAFSRTPGPSPRGRRVRRAVGRAVGRAV